MNLIIGRMHLRSVGDQVRRTENDLAIRIIQLSVSTAVETGSFTNMVLLNGYRYGPRGLAGKESLRIHTRWA